MHSEAIVSQVAEAYWTLRQRANPIWASQIGDRRFDAELPDVTRDGEARYCAGLLRVAAQADVVDRAGLSESNIQTLEAVAGEARREANLVTQGVLDFFVFTEFGPHARLMKLPTWYRCVDGGHADALVARYKSARRYFDELVGRLRGGLREGRTPARASVIAVIDQIDRVLANDRWFLQTPAPSEWSSTATLRWQTELRDAVIESVQPGLVAYRSCLQDEVLEQSRGDDHPGLCWLPSGAPIYDTWSRAWTTLSVDANSAHTRGADLVAEAREQMADLAGTMFPHTDKVTVWDQLTNNPELRHSSAESILEQARQCIDRFLNVSDQWFGRIPETPLVVCAIPDGQATTSPAGYYSPSARIGDAPSRYMVNTSRPTARPQFEGEVLAFNEGLPGIHLQFALATENSDLPACRRFSLIGGCSKGWAHYAEGLADEMSAYSGSVARAGMISKRALYAARLVVDTGIHAGGWSRAQAIAYLAAAVPAGAVDAGAEVDRYVSLPGQALTYKLGELEIRRFRGLWQDHGCGGPLGFHQLVLGGGTIPLDVLGEAVNRRVLASNAMAKEVTK